MITKLKFLVSKREKFFVETSREGGFLALALPVERLCGLGKRDVDCGNLSPLHTHVRIFHTYNVTYQLMLLVSVVFLYS